MIKLTTNVDLNDGTTNKIDCWENCAASAYNSVMYTGNWAAAYSDDGGNTFATLDPYGLCKIFKENFQSDQVVIYIPQVDRFAWVLQTDGNYILAVASPKDLSNSKGKDWTAWLVKASTFGKDDEKGDFPEVAVGDHFLYWSFDLTKSGAPVRSVGIRVWLNELREGRLKMDYFHGQVNMRCVQNTGDVGYFAAQNNPSELCIYAWPEALYVVPYFNVGIATIPTEDFEMQTPSTMPWLPPERKWNNKIINSKISWRITGATLTGTQVWLAWSGARRVATQKNNTFRCPHIGIAVIDVLLEQLIEQRYLMNPEFGFAWPSLATNGVGDVGISCCFGGGARDPQYAVGVLTGPDNSLVQVTNTPLTTGSGGHYVSVRPAFPSKTDFCGAGNVLVAGKDLVKDDQISHPHFVRFGVVQVPRIEVITNRQFSSIDVSGSGFTPNKRVNLYVDGLVGTVNPLAIGFANTASDGTFTFHKDVACWAGQNEVATVRAVDAAATGRVATDWTPAYWCY